MNDTFEQRVAQLISRLPRPEQVEDAILPRAQAAGEAIGRIRTGIGDAVNTRLRQAFDVPPAPAGSSSGKDAQTPEEKIVGLLGAMTSNAPQMNQMARIRGRRPFATEPDKAQSLDISPLQSGAAKLMPRYNPEVDNPEGEEAALIASMKPKQEFPIETGKWSRNLAEVFTDEMVPQASDRPDQLAFKTAKALMMMGPTGSSVPGQLAAVKGPGGMWHPEAVERLATPLYNTLTPNARGLGYRDVMLGEGSQEATFKADKATADWATKAIRNYLNKYAGTERDPLKDVEIPVGNGMMKWGDFMDKTISSDRGRDLQDLIRTEQSGQKAEKLLQQVGSAKPDELVYNIGERHRVPFPGTLESYLSHVGDYLRQNVPADKLQQYDLVRAVRETAANDARVAKGMEKAAANSTKDLPVYKEYPDGMKWVELKMPEKLTAEQAKSVRTATREDLEYSKSDPHFESGAPIYVALDAQGKPSKNSYTGDRAVGTSPEEAFLAGKLAEEGNQMGHCVGGYCAGVASGESRIFSLRDAKGRSHVTVETSPPHPESFTPEHFLEENPKLKEKYGKRPFVTNFLEKTESAAMKDQRAWDNKVRADPEYMPWFRTKAADITQIKGKQNRAPVAEYLPYVQDFVKSGKWGEVGDLQHTGLKHHKGEYLTHKELAQKLGVPEGQVEAELTRRGGAALRRLQDDN